MPLRTPKALRKTILPMPDNTLSMLLERYREKALGVILFLVVEDYESRFLAAYRELGFGDVQRSHGAVLRHLDGNGATVSVLAKRAGQSKQSIGKVVRQLEELGYLSVVVGLEDRRSRIVRFSLRGERLVSVSNRVVDDIRRNYRQLLGEAEFARLYTILDELTSSLGVRQRMQAAGDAQRFLHFGRLLVELALDFEQRLTQQVAGDVDVALSRPVLNQFYYLAPRPLSVSALAEPQRTTVQAVSLTTRGMVRQQLLDVQESSRDSRAKELSISTEGQRWLAAVVAGCEAVLALYAERIGAAALQEFEVLLRRLNGALSVDASEYTAMPVE